MDTTATRFGPLGRAEHMDSVGAGPASRREGAPFCTHPRPQAAEQARGRAAESGALVMPCRKSSGGGPALRTGAGFQPGTTCGRQQCRRTHRAGPGAIPSAARETPPLPGSLSSSCSRRTTHGTLESRLHEHPPGLHEQPRFQALATWHGTAASEQSYNEQGRSVQHAWPDGASDGGTRAPPVSIRSV